MAGYWGSLAKAGLSAAKGADLDTYLKLGQFTAAAGTKLMDFQETTILRQQQFHAAKEQAAFNNQLLYNSYTNLNEQEQLEYKKHAVDQFELQVQVRRAVAARLALQGSANKSGGSAESIIMNIQRQGLYSSHRKDFNYEIRIRNLQTQRANEALATQSKNNALYNSLQGFPSATGLALSIGGSAVQFGSEWKKGRTEADYRKETLSMAAMKKLDKGKTSSTSGWKVDPKDGSYTVDPWNSK